MIGSSEAQQMPRHKISVLTSDLAAVDDDLVKFTLGDGDGVS